MDRELHWPEADICAPSPHTYEYEYNGKKHFYIPDFFIPSLVLEIEIKQSNECRMNPISYAKSIEKDKLMKSMKRLFNYIKIVDKNYSEFLEIIKNSE